MNSNSTPPTSDKALKAKTGHNWAEWYSLLDKAGARELEHKGIAKLVNSMHSAGEWWSQTVAVGYEQHIGKRSLYERSDGSFTMSTSKTLNISAREAYSFFVEEQKRTLWLEEKIVIRTATSPKSVRITWPDKTHVAIWITSKNEAKCSVAIEHAKLTSQSDVNSRKEFWKTALQRLAEIAE